LKYLYAIVNIKVHHLAQRVEDLDAKFFLFILQQSFGVFNQPANESAIVTLFTCFRARLENVFRSIKDIDGEKSDEGQIFPREVVILGFRDSPMILQKISFDHEDLQFPVRPVLSQPPADHSGRMTNHAHMYARGNGATEKGSPNMHNTFFKIY
jgi:hypothetical protein